MKHAPWICILLIFVAPILAWAFASGLHGLEMPLPRAPLVAILLRTHRLAATISVLAVIAALPVAILGYLFGGWVRRLSALLLFLPLAVGMLARNYAWIGMLSQRGLFSSLGWTAVTGRSILYTWTAVDLVMTFVFLPWAFYVIRAGLAVVRSSQMDSARTLGASPAQIIVRVILPNLSRPVLVALLLIYCSTLGYFITPRMVGANRAMLAGNVILRFVELGDFPAASQVAICLFASAVPIVVLLIWLAAGKFGVSAWRE